MPQKRKNTTAEAVIEATPVKKTKGIMAEETTKYSEVESAPEKQCSSQSEMAQQTCNCPCTCGNLEYSNKDMKKKETKKMKGYEKNVSGKPTAKV